MVSPGAMAVAMVAVAVAVASRRPAPQKRRKPKHVQTELRRCGMANLPLWQRGRRPKMLKPPLQPPCRFLGLLCSRGNGD